MKTRTFGGTDLLVSEFGLGCARIGGIFQKDPKGFLDLLSVAYDAGITFYDTADMYSQGESEQLVGRAFRKRRDKVVIASKAGWCLPAQRKLIARVKPLVRPLIRVLKIRRDKLPAAVRGTVQQDFSPAYLQRAIEGSLRRLKTDYLDLFQLHSPPVDVVDRGEWVEVLERLKRTGKIRHYGIACDSVDVGLAALKREKVASLQIVVNLLEQGAVTTVLPACVDRSVAVIARECLANGLLVKRESEIDLAGYCKSEEEQALRREQLARLRKQASDQNVSLARLALEYVSRLPGVSVTLIGARTADQVRHTVRELPG